MIYDIILIIYCLQEHKAMKEQRRLPEVKVLIIICYIVTVFIFTLGTYATIWIGSASYFLYESAGIQTNSTRACDHTELNRVIPLYAMLDTLEVLYVMLPVVNLVYALNVNDIKALKEKCCPGWCKKSARGKKGSILGHLLQLQCLNLFIQPHITINTWFVYMLCTDVIDVCVKRCPNIC